jgi:hypothetical protein
MIAHSSAKPDQTGAFIENVRALESHLERNDPAAWQDYRRRLGPDGCSEETRLCP